MQIMVAFCKKSAMLYAEKGLFISHFKHNFIFGKQNFGGENR